MEQSLFVAAVICLVVFMGVAIPVLLQLRRTLRSAEVFLESTGETLKQTLEDVSGAAARFNHAAGRIEDNAEGLERLFKGLGSVAAYLGRMREWFHERSRPAAEPDAAAAAVHSTGDHRRSERVGPSGAPKGDAVA